MIDAQQVAELRRGLNRADKAILAAAFSELERGQLRVVWEAATEEYIGGGHFTLRDPEDRPVGEVRFVPTEHQS